MNKRIRNEEVNIFYFFIIALILHLLLFISKGIGVKGDAPLTLKSNSAPISVKIKSSVSRPQQVTSNPIPAPKITEKKEPEKPKPVEKPKEIIKPETKSKIKDKKKKKIIKEEIKEKSTQNLAPPAPETKPKSSSNSNEDILSSGNFSVGKDGIFTAASSDGIDYKILKQIDPNYPIQAEKIRYKKKVIITAKFLVGLNGNIEDIIILKSHKKFGFDNEVIKALKQWKFHPIYYNNKNIKVYFTKDFVFTPK